MSKDKKRDEVLDPQINEIRKEDGWKIPPAKVAAKKLHDERVQQVRKLRGATEEEAREAFTDAGLTGKELAEMLRVWRVYSQSSRLL